MVNDKLADAFLHCTLCATRYEISRANYFCPNCTREHENHYGNLEISYESLNGPSLPFPLQPFTIFEGNTPLIRNDGMPPLDQLKDLYYKCEMTNPTASFKDRASSYVIAEALRLGKKDVVAASSGNAGVSLAAYALKAGIRCHIFVPRSASRGKLELLRLLEADTILVDGSFEDAYYASLRTEDAREYYSCNFGSNPFAMEAYKKTALEIFEKIGVPDKIVVPVGDGTYLSGIWKGFKELHSIGAISKTPQMVAVQVKGADPVAVAFTSGVLKYVLRDPVESAAEGIVASESYNSIFAVKALRESEGFPISVTDQEIVRSLRAAFGSGLMIEPTSAAALAATEQMINDRKVNLDETVVCMLTGSGIKTLAEISKCLEPKRFSGGY